MVTWNTQEKSNQTKQQRNSIYEWQGVVVRYIERGVLGKKKYCERKREREKHHITTTNLIVTSSLFTRCKYVKEFAVFFF